MGVEPNAGSGTEFPETIPEPLRSEAALHDPFEWYDRQRSRGPVHYDDQRDVYDVFSYDLVKELLQDNERLVRKELSDGSADAESPFAYIDEGMIWSDGPDHRQSKSQLFEYFQPGLLRALEGTITEVTESQLQTALEGGPEFDFVGEFAVPVPLRVVMDMVGVPDDDHEQVLDWLNTFRQVMNSEYSAEESKHESRMAEPVEYFRELVARRRREPREDLISRLVAETDLSDAAIGSNCFDFVLAGQGTMSEFISNALYLFETRDILDEIDEYDMDVLLEEVLRYRAPLQARARVTTEPVTAADTTIPAGNTVILWIGAANRDPERYERSDEFLPERDPDHLAFGSGPHTCIGAPLARIEAPIVLRTFLDAVESVEIDHDSLVPKSKPSKLGFERLPVSVTTE